MRLIRCDNRASWLTLDYENLTQGLLYKCALKVKLMVLGAKWFYKDCDAHAKDSCLMNADWLF